MPTYEYKCPDCSSRFELRRSFSDDSPVSCPQCQCIAQRLFVPVPVIFKGSGFYVTENRKGDGGSNEESNPSEPEPSNNETKVSVNEDAISD